MFRSWGGARQGAGRRPKGGRAMVSHGRRPGHAARWPVHVTTRLVEGLPRLRQKGEYRAVRKAFAAGCARFGFRLVHYSVQGNHLHLMCEAKDRRALSRGLQGLLIRVAKGLNRMWRRRGRVFADHYHERALKTPKEVRQALVYVLHNHMKHDAKKHGVRIAQGVDRYASGRWFDGWRERPEMRGLEDVGRPVAGAGTWLLGKGWRRAGLIGVFERPAGAAHEVGRP